MRFFPKGRILQDVRDFRLNSRLWSRGEMPQYKITKFERKFRLVSSHWTVKSPGTYCVGKCLCNNIFVFVCGQETVKCESELEENNLEIKKSTWTKYFMNIENLALTRLNLMYQEYISKSVFYLFGSGG